jgi:hypothetical protein
VDFDTCEKTADVGNETGRKTAMVPPEKVGQSVRPQGLQTGVATDNFEYAPGRRVFFKDRSDVFSECPEKHFRPPLWPACGQSFPALSVRCYLWKLLEEPGRQVSFTGIRQDNHYQLVTTFGSVCYLEGCPNGCPG